MLQLATPAPPAAPSGCFGVSAICEFGTNDAQVNAMTEDSTRKVLGALERRLLDAQALGEIGPDLDVKETAQFLLATMSGMKVAARGGSGSRNLKGIAQMALRCLR